MKNKALIPVLAALAALLAMPFLLAPSGESVKRLAAAPDETLVIISAHNKALRDEYEQAFTKWYKAKYNRSIRLDFRNPGGTSDIMRYIADRYETEFRRLYEANPQWGKWNSAIRTSFADERSCRTPEQKAARKRFLDSDVGIGIDIFAGGGVFNQEQIAAKGYAADAGLAQSHPEYFKVIPPFFGGDKLYDPRGRFYGVVLSTFGILYNTARVKEMKDDRPPERWADLGDKRFFNTLSVADPTKSGSANKCYEIMIQQCMAACNDPEKGWQEGLSLLKKIFANARSISDSAGKVVRDVAIGEAAAGTAIDTYGISEMLWSKHVFGSPRCIYVTPKGGTAVSADPVQMLRGAPNKKAAKAFIAFLLSREGQLLHCLKPGTPGGPERNGINRPPIRKDLYTPELKKQFFLPGYDPYASGADFVYRPQWTGRYYSLLRVLLRTIVLEPHQELKAAYAAIIRAGGPEKVPQAMAKFNELPFSYREAGKARAMLRVTPERSAAQVSATLRQWSDHARNCYKEATRLAAMGK